MDVVWGESNLGEIEVRKGEEGRKSSGCMVAGDLESYIVPTHTGDRNGELESHLPGLFIFKLSVHLPHSH